MKKIADWIVDRKVIVFIIVANLSPGDATHCGIIDISMMSNIPGLVCLAPAIKEEYLAMLDWSIEQTLVPVVIRVPRRFVKEGFLIL